MSDFYQMQAEVLEARKQPGTKEPKQPKPLQAATGYLVFASDRHNPGWTMPSSIIGVFRILDAAQRAADGLASRWEHRTIVKVDLPAMGG